MRSYLKTGICISGSYGISVVITVEFTFSFVVGLSAFVYLKEKIMKKTDVSGTLVGLATAGLWTEKSSSVSDEPDVR